MYQPLRIQPEAMSKTGKCSQKLRNPDPDYCPPVKRKESERKGRSKVKSDYLRRCVLHHSSLNRDPCRSPIVSLTNERYKKLKGAVEKYYDYRELPDGTSIGTRFDEAQSAKELKAPILTPTQPSKLPNKYKSQMRARYRKWTHTPVSLSEEMARRNEHTPQLERLLQTLPADLLPQYDPIMEFERTKCILCNRCRFRSRHTGTPAQVRLKEKLIGVRSVKYGGRILLTAILKDDIVTKTRIRKCVESNLPIMRHKSCESNYTRMMSSPCQETIDEIQFLMASLYDDENRPKLKPLFLVAHPNATKRPLQADVEPLSDKCQNKSETAMETHDDDTNFDDNPDLSENFEMGETGDLVVLENDESCKFVDRETYNNFVEIVKERVIDKGVVMRLSALTEMYKEMLVKNVVKNNVVKDNDGTLKGNMTKDNVAENVALKENVAKDTDCCEELLKAKLIVSLPELQFDRLAMLNTELVFRQDSFL